MTAAKTFVVLISGQGRNLQALLDARLPSRILRVISNKPDAAGLERALRAGVPVQVVPHQDYASREAFDAALMEAIGEPDFVLLAGFMRVLTPGFVRHYLGRLVNIHPSLLPRHPGLKTHEAVLAAGDAQHGATVHFVTEELDGGPLIIQGEFMVRAEDTAQTLAERVMTEIEVHLYPQTAAWLARGELCLLEGLVHFRGQALPAPLRWADLTEEFR